jgi:hypothetical protein
MFTHKEYEDKLVDYLGAISRAISSQKNFSAEVIKVGHFNHENHIAGGCSARTFEIRISKKSESSERVFSFVLGLSCPIHAYKAFNFLLHVQESADSFPWSRFMRETARHVKVDVEEHKKFRYSESVYLNGFPDEYYVSPPRRISAEEVESDIQLWVDKTEELLGVAKDLEIPPMMLVDYLPNIIPEGFFDKARIEANQTKKSVKQVLARWINTEK